MTDIEVPKLNNNDATYVVVAWLADDGAEVAADQPIVVIETSKATEELASPGTGVLTIAVERGAECVPGQVIGHLLGTGEERPRARVSDVESDLVVTDEARALAEAHGITEERLRTLGTTLIRKVDVETLLARSTADSADPTEQPPPSTADGADAIERLPTRQRAVAAVVTESMRTIPTAAAYVKVMVDSALAEAERLIDRNGGLPGLPELLVKAVAALHPRHPLFFATLVADGRIRRAPVPNVGVTVDLGRGLHVPVVRDAATLTTAQIAEKLVRFRFKALRGDFKEHELADANILVALHNTGGIVLATPIVFPGQTCAVSLADTQEELALTDNRDVVVRRYVNIGVVYDHRVVNGRDAVEFLRDLKHLLEAPELLA